MNNKHESYDLAQMQSLPLSAKIRMSTRRIIDWYEYWDGQVYVSRSGGKDSDVLGHLVKKIYPDVPQVFVNTGLEFDSVRIHATEECDIVLRPEKSFVQVLTEYGYPIISKTVAHCVGIAQNCPDGKVATKYFSDEYKSRYSAARYSWLLEAPFKVSDACCTVMKKIPGKKYQKSTNTKPYLGTMASESLMRRDKWMKYGCNAFEKGNPSSNPLSFWTEQDILQYIWENNIEIAGAYGHIIEENNVLYNTGESRTGCIFCMFGITKDTDRFLRLKEIEPKKYDFVMRGGKFNEQGLWVPYNGLGYKFVIDWLNEHGNLNIKY